MNHSPETEALAQKTLAQLREVIARKGDFPAISGAVRQIVSAMRDESTTDFDLAQSVLSDFALTQKVIRLANSAMYSAFGGGITTVSRAIYVLGTETVGHLALGLKFIDQLDKAAGQSESARGEFSKAMVAGTVARKVTESMAMRDSEESVVCTLLHNLGRLMVAFYLPEQWDALQARCGAGDAQCEQDTAVALLGLSLHDIGREMATQWGLPAELTSAMRPPVPAGDNPLQHTEWLASLANFSTECSKVMATAGRNVERAMGALAEAYAASLGVEVALLTAAATAAGEDEQCRKLLAAGKSPDTRSDSEKPMDAYARLDHGLRDMLAMSESAELPTLAGLML